MLNSGKKDIINQCRTYILFIYLDIDSNIVIGQLGSYHFLKGSYAYVGSGKKNINKRIERHLKKEKKFFWHIDYFLQRAEVKDIWVGEKEESEVARILETELEIPVYGFGSTDKVRDKSHLFFGNPSKKLIKEMGFTRFVVCENKGQDY